MVANTKLPSRVVIDASVVLALLLPDEKIKPKAQKILELHSQGKLDFLSASLLNFEVLNGIKSAVLSKRIKPEIATKLANHFLDLKIIKKKINFEKAFKYSLSLSISVYDAAYLVLARRANVPLLTTDKKLYQKTKRRFKEIILL